ncbi:ribosomal protein S18 acetylase RimI-like enzyme [Sinomonas atrocyanea]|uniref:GNAT family N-acetyltransferase n=1 Tax=Sinomonas atrocyanea TaxID=37927 RepID=UPI00278473B5|nr:GNAT family N-acetyltransferase [Sinomonas atrocyanea]MDP9883419.1 ribosomal protein S18 acetylase RimI-like enzyme [Sinomonas atrocyanea]
MTGLSVREATPADYPEIARIAEAAYLGPGYFESADHPYMQHIADVAYRASRGTLLVAERDGRIVGSVTVMAHGDGFDQIARPGEFEFRLLVVDPAAQRSGAGTALVREVEARAKRAEATAVVLTTGEGWEAPNALYPRLGYERAPERDWPVTGTDIMLPVYIKRL